MHFCSPGTGAFFCKVRLVKAAQTGGNHVSPGLEPRKRLVLLWGRKQKQTPRFIGRYLSAGTADGGRDCRGRASRPRGHAGGDGWEVKAGLASQAAAVGDGESTPDVLLHFQPLFASLSQCCGRLPLLSPPVFSCGFQENTNSPVKPDTRPRTLTGNCLIFLFFFP